MLRNDAMLIHRSNICLIVYMCFHYIVIGNITDNITVAEQNIIFFLMLPKNDEWIPTLQYGCWIYPGLAFQKEEERKDRRVYGINPMLFPEPR